MVKSQTKPVWTNSLCHPPPTAVPCRWHKNMGSNYQWCFCPNTQTASFSTDHNSNILSIEYRIYSPNSPTSAWRFPHSLFGFCFFIFNESSVARYMFQKHWTSLQSSEFEKTIEQSQDFVMTLIDTSGLITNQMCFLIRGLFSRLPRAKIKQVVILSLYLLDTWGINDVYL